MKSDDVESRMFPQAVTKGTYAWAAYRVMQASRRMQELENSLVEAGETWPYLVTFKATPGLEPELQQDNFLEVAEDLAHELGAYASEVIHHLRTALDYLAYHAVWRDSGIRLEQSQFPIDTDEEAWNKNASRRLKGIAPERLEWMREVQPFKEKNWAYKLRQLSNTDKHALRVDVLPAIFATPDRAQVIASHPGPPGTVIIGSLSARLELLIRLHEPDRSLQTEPEDARVLLRDMLTSTAALVNRFLETEEGVEPIWFG